MLQFFKQSSRSSSLVTFSPCQLTIKISVSIVGAGLVRVYSTEHMELEQLPNDTARDRSADFYLEHVKGLFLVLLGNSFLRFSKLYCKWIYLYAYVCVALVIYYYFCVPTTFRCLVSARSSSRSNLQN